MFKVTRTPTMMSNSLEVTPCSTFYGMPTLYSHSKQPSGMSLKEAQIASKTFSGFNCPLNTISLMTTAG